MCSPVTAHSGADERISVLCCQRHRRCAQPHAGKAARTGPKQGAWPKGRAKLPSIQATGPYEDCAEAGRYEAALDKAVVARQHGGGAFIRAVRSPELFSEVCRLAQPSQGVVPVLRHVYIEAFKAPMAVRLARQTPIPYVP